MANSPVKTSVSFLQEQCMQHDITAKYDLIKVVGPKQNPTFEFRVSIGKLCATGTGSSKKKARHAAATAMLDILLSSRSAEIIYDAENSSDSDENTQEAADEKTPEAADEKSQETAGEKSQETAGEKSQETAGEKSQETAGEKTPEAAGKKTPKAAGEGTSDKEGLQLCGMPDNPVGTLQEYCWINVWPPPVYQVIHEEGWNRENKKFITTCTVKEFVQEGIGRSKKDAKKDAATKMLADQLKFKLASYAASNGKDNSSGEVSSSKSV